MSILFYHVIERGWASPMAVDPESFRRHCDWLSRRRRVVGLTEAIGAMDARGRLPQGLAALTFDDGYESVYEEAFPVLARHNLPATVFLIAATLQDGTKLPSGKRALSLEQVLEMQGQGVRFESHSLAHRILTDLDEDECEEDLRRSREILEGMLSRQVRLLAYPGGYHDYKVRRAAAQAGFTNAFGTSRGHEPVGPYSIPRIGIYPGDGTRRLNVKTSRWYVGLRRSAIFPAIRLLAARRSPPAEIADRP
jgi:peptidoglycan/xylan/chitin deacetylase (PgdA/CDA1 family)